MFCQVTTGKVPAPSAPPPPPAEVRLGVRTAGSVSPRLAWRPPPVSVPRDTQETPAQTWPPPARTPPASTAGTARTPATGTSVSARTPATVERTVTWRTTAALGRPAATGPLVLVSDMA